MTSRCIRRALCGAAVLMAAGAASAAGPAPDDPRPPEMSVWLRFEDPAHPDRSSTVDSWPAQCAGSTSAPGRAGLALALPGTPGNGIHLPRPTAFFGRRPRAGTIALWICPADPDADSVIADFFRRSGNSAIDGNQIVIHTAKGKLTARPGLSRFMTIANPLRRNEWTHLALAWDTAVGTRLFVNGRRCAEGAAGFAPAELDEDWPGRIGGPTGPGAPFAGKVDELRLWNRLLDDDEVRAVCESAAPPPAPFTMVIGRRTAEIRSAAAGETTLSLAAWSPAAHVPPPYWGAAPLPIALVGPDRGACVTGPVPGRIVRTLAVPPGGRISVEIRDLLGQTGPLQIKLLHGDGIRQCAVAERRFDGLTVRSPGHGPLVLRQAAPGIDLLVRNGRVEPFHDRISFRLTGAGGVAVVETSISPRLEAGGEKRATVAFGRPAAPGRYELTARVSGTDIERFPVYVTSDADAARTPGTAATISGWFTDVLFDRAAADGVDAVMIGRLANYGTYAKHADMALARGMKLVVQSSAYYGDVCLNARKRASMTRYARHLGRLLNDNPAVVMTTIAGEASSAPVCYCAECTDGFRAWLRGEYRSVNAMNDAWGTKYADWSAVAQMGSPEDIDARAESLKLMRIDLVQPAEYAKRWRAIFNLDKGRAMAWRRWQDSKLIGMYADFVGTYRAGNPGAAPAGEQPCWPNFNTQNLFAAARVNEIGGMDLYLPGNGPTSLGYPAELFLNFDMNRSVFHAHGKPVAVNELYVQDNSPAGEAEAQGWWLTGRGYGNLDYFTYNYYCEGVRNKLPLIFGMFDKEGAPYPCHASFQRFCRDIRTFRALYDPGALRTERPRVALFMGDDVSRASALETAENTWDAAAVHGHVGAYWLTERSGFPVDFINDDGFDRLSGTRVLIIPWTHVIRPSSIAKIVAFARRGGTVLLDGPVGLFDHHYRPFARLPGGAALRSASGISFAGYEDRPNRLVPDAAGIAGADTAARGVPLDPRVSEGRILLRDVSGNPALVETPVGKGRIVALLASLGRTNTAAVPDWNALRLWRRVLEEKAGLPRRYLFVPAPAPTGAPAEGAANGSLFDVSVRVAENNREVFLFLVSFFGPSRGTLELTLPDGRYSAADALTGEPVPFSPEAGTWRLPVAMPGVGGRVIRVRSDTGGAPFAGW